MLIWIFETNLCLSFKKPRLFLETNFYKKNLNSFVLFVVHFKKNLQIQLSQNVKIEELTASDFFYCLKRCCILSTSDIFNRIRVDQKDISRNTSSGLP